MDTDTQPADRPGPERSAADIALVGVAGRFPGAADAGDLWELIRAGRSGISRFAESELRAAGVPEALLADPGYVKAGAVIDGIDRFDAEFFGFNPKEAQILDPQQRLFLEQCWHALEDAACDPSRFDGAIGVFGGSAISTYLTHNLAPARAAAGVGELAVGLANDKDSLTLRVAHTLGLSGPAYGVQSYCSTSLVAVCAAASSLASLECDLALAGGVAIAVPDRVGYLYQPGGIASPDGECRAFDAEGRGSLVGSGVGVVALRRLEDALADGDRVYAVIRGWAVNNDAGRKVGFTAPGVRGQAAVVAEALAAAGLRPADIDYVEAHGTGTSLGDAAELAALQQVFEGEHVLIGSVKTNLGHLDRAAGVTGLIKTALALHHGQLPGTRNHRTPNPQLREGAARLEVLTALTEWPRGPRPRRAGVSAFGIGGTNAHVVLEEAPLPAAPAAAPVARRSTELLVWSARTAAAADQAGERLAAHLSPDAPASGTGADTGADTAAGTGNALGDAAYTLQSGRRVFEHRRMLVAETCQGAATALREGAALGRKDSEDRRRTAFLIAGTGEQYTGLAAELYATEPGFRDALDECRATLIEVLGFDPLGDLLAPRAAAGAREPRLGLLMGRGAERATPPGDATDHLQPALFAVEYALARLVRSWGIEPDLLAGYSLGEYVAAALAEVLSPRDALALVAHRATLIRALPAGAMAAVPRSAEQTRALIDELGGADLDVAAVNGPELTVVAGPPEALDAFAAALARDAVPCRRLATTHAFHSRMMEPIRARLTAWIAANVTLHAPRVPYVSNVTGALITAAQATDPAYWAEHMCGPVRFDDALATVLAQGEFALLEIGPGRSLGAMARGHRACDPARWPLIVPTLPGADEPRGAGATLAEAVGRLWLAGVPVDWTAYQQGRALRRTGLPGYPFQRERYWIDPPAAAPASIAPVPAAATARDDTEHVRILTRRWVPADAAAGPGDTADIDDAHSPVRYLLLDDAAGFGRGLAPLLAQDGGEVRLVRPGDAVHAAAEAVAQWSQNPDSGRIAVLTRGGLRVREDEGADPEQAALTTLPIVASREYPFARIRGIDLDPALAAASAAQQVARVLRQPYTHVAAALRDGRELAPEYVEAAARPAEQPAIRAGGTYLVTGGLGTVGLLLGGHLARGGAGTVILTSRGALPADREHPRASAVRALRELGAEILTPRLDATDAQAMSALFEQHRVDGVVHAAADSPPESFAPLGDTDRENVARHFGAKAAGARVLADVLRALPADRAPRWCLVFSSTATVLGGLGFGAYAAANAALTAEALRAGAGGGPTRWISAAWDTWPGTLDRVDGPLRATMAAHAMGEQQALEAFDRVLAQPEPAVVVAAGGLADRLPGPAAARAGTAPVGAASAATASAATSPVGAAPVGTVYPRPDLPQPYVSPLTPAERSLAALWTEVLGVEPVGTRDNFFDLKGNSLLALQLLALIKERFGIAVSAVAFFETPTVHGLAALLDEQTTAPRTPVATAARAPESALTPAVAPAPACAPARDAGDDLDRRIAIIGMAGRFPGAGDVAGFWRNLCEGVESISFFTPEELIASGVDPQLVHDPAYVPARAVLEDIASFDAGFFGFSPRTASLTDPQQRLFLEVSWEALEHAGYAEPRYRGRVGVFGGSNLSTYLLGRLGGLGVGSDLSPYELIMSNDKDALATSVSYLFDLRGPSMAVQTFCSTSLVAVHLAVQSLRAGECEVALAGGVSVSVPDRVGHRAQPGGMESHDGHVRTFDARADGSMFGDGAAVVALKRLSDALRDGDTVHAVIRGSALNNDGALKAGYTAPSVAGQSRVIAAALADARVAADQVGYIEAHGTATELGDPIEVAALNRAFGPGLAPESCAIGSVKTNIGHLNHAAGAAGLIKTALTVREGLIPATLHYTSPNPEIDFTAGPFRVNTRLSPWSPPDGRARIAGLNALGLGGTNVHVVVEQAPQRPAAQHHDAGHARRFHVLPVSARTQQAAEQAVRQLGGHLAESGPDTRLADVAYTLQVGRKTFEHRRAAVARTREEAIRVLTGAKGSVPPAARVEGAHGRPVALLLAGVGEQYPGLVGELYRREPAFRAELDACLHRLADLLPAAEAADLLAGERSGAGDGGALAALLGRARTPDDARDGALERTELAQPLMFAVDYALARTLIAWGLRPAALLGYSLGEYVAAALSGVLSLDEALRLVVRRAQLIAALPGGAMAAVPLDPDELHGRFRLAERGLDIAAVNGPGTAVVAGPRDAVDRLAGDLARHAIPLRRLRATHAFHSRMLEPAADELAAWIGANTHPGAPAIPYLSNVTGDWASAPQVADARYWARHMTGTVRFADGVARLLEDPELALVEIGPGPSLGAMARAQCPPPRYPLITATLPGREDPRPADEVLTECLARLWLTGVELDWAAYHRRGGESQGSDLPGRVPLPGYPFQRQRYWIESAWQPSNPPAAAAAAAASAAQPAHETRPTGVAGFEQVDRELPRLPEDQWVYQPVWRQTAAPAAAGRQPASWLVFARGERAEAILARLRDAASAEGATVHAVRPGPRFAADEADGFEVRPGSLEDTRLMLRELRARAVPLERVVHLWTLDTPETGPEDGGDDADPKGSDPAVRLGLHCLTALARAAGELGRRDWSLDIVAAGAHAVMGGGEAVPEAATLIGPTLVIPLEYPSVATGLVDVEPGTEPAAVLAELRRPRTDQFVALRAGRRWVRGHDRIPPVRPEDGAALLREGGVYLLTGGLGGIALGMAEHLARDVHARLVLFGRTGLPPRTRWAPIAAGAEQADEGTRSRISRVLALEELGAQVEIVVGDVADPADLRRAVDTACERFGALHGVLHTAGVAGTGLIQFKHAQDCERVLAPKLAGTRALHEALRIGRADEVWLDFLVLFSSLTSATGGGPGQVDYCAANAYLDGYAASLSATGRRVLAVDWGEWTWNAWSFGLDGYDERLREFFRGHRARFGITFAEGWRSLLRALASGEPQVAVSTQDLPAMVLLAPAFNVESVAAPPPAPGRATVHPRPELLTPYREPADDAEHRVAEVWAAMLELERVGVQDNFFELGGSSLLGISLLAGLRAAFPQADLPPHILYEAPTVAALARLVRAPDPDACDRPAPGVRADAGELRRSGLKTAAARRRRS